MNNPGEVINPFIHFDAYERIYDVVMYIGANTFMKFNVSLSKYNNNTRQPFHKEFEFLDRTGSQPVVTIRREFDFYLSIENIKPIHDQYKESIRIGIEEITLLKQGLYNAAKWFTDPKYKDLYAMHNNQLIMTRKVDNIILDYLPFGKYIEFEPIIYSTLNEEMYPGVRMYLSSSDNFVDMFLNRFMGFKYIIDTFNMYMAAQMMLAYIGRPEFGHNMTSYINDTKYPNPQEAIIKTTINRQPLCRSQNIESLEDDTFMGVV